jgi:aminoglycoside 6'-N-acetyltransferase
MVGQATDVVVTFRRLVDADLPMLHGWLNEPGVVRWWEGDDDSWEAVVAEYGSANTDPTEHWIGAVDGRDVGWIQCYDAGSYPGELSAWAAAGVGAGTAGIDYLVGDPADRGRGVGTAMIAAFVEDVVFGRHPTWARAAASPQVGNRASWQALERAGFRFVAVVDGTCGPERLMVRDRDRTLRA